MCNCNPTSSTSNSSVISVGGGGCGTCQNGEDGASAYTYVAYADDVTDQCNPAYATTGFSLTPSPTTQWVGFITTTSPLTPPAEGDFECSWVQVAGPGVSGIIQVEEAGIMVVPDPDILNFIGAGIADVQVTNTTVAGNTVANITIDAKIFIPILRANALAEIAAQTLKPGATYWIYDVGDGSDSVYASALDGYAGILLKAISANEFSLDGVFISRIPGKAIPFWNNTTSYVSGANVENFNTIYTNTSGVAQGANNIPPSANTGVWSKVDKKSNLYITEIYTCRYNIVDNQILNIVDTKNNEVTLTVQAGVQNANELFLKCIPWSNSKMVNNKIFVTNLSNAQKGYIGATQYPVLANVGGAAINFACWPYTLQDNRFELNLNKSFSRFSSVQATGNYAKFFDAAIAVPPSINDNVFIESDLYVENSSNISLSTFINSRLGLVSSPICTGTGKIDNCTFRTTIVRANVLTGTSISYCDLSNCTVALNTDTTISNIVGSVNIMSNIDSEITFINAFTKVTTGPDSFTSYNDILSNTDVLLQDISGQFFKINSNETISVRFNVVLNNGFIEQNVGATNALVLNQDGITLWPFSATTPDREKCMIFSVQLSNQSSIFKNTWVTSGAISQCILNNTRIQNLVIDFKDIAYRTSPVVDMVIDGADAFLLQNAAKGVYANPLSIFQYTGTFQENMGIDGIAAGTGILPIRDLYTRVPATGAYSKVPLTFDAGQGYARGRNSTGISSDLYVFLDIESGAIFSANTLTLPTWTKHAGIFYLYSSSGGTFTINKIADALGILRQPFTFTFVALSDGLTVNFGTKSLATQAATEIASNVAAPATLVLNSRRDSITIYKADTKYFVKEYINIV